MAIAGMPYENVYSNEEILDLIARQKDLNFRPGEEYLYSNTGYFLMGVIVGRVAGTSLRQYADEKLFAPLGMKNTHFHDDASQIVSEPRRSAMRPPTRVNSGSTTRAHFDKVGSGGLYSTLEDLARWDRNFYDRKVGGQQLIDLMLLRGTLNDGTVQSYAFGLGATETTRAYRRRRTRRFVDGLFAPTWPDFPFNDSALFASPTWVTSIPDRWCARWRTCICSKRFATGSTTMSGSYFNAELPATRQIERDGANLVPPPRARFPRRPRTGE